jgi:flagellar biosynthesis chaperone FliJ
MAVVVFECPIDDETLHTIRELRELRLEVLRRQVSEIDDVMDKLERQGAVIEEEKESYREVILSDLSDQCRLLESRLTLTETVYYDELELYIEIMSDR